MSQVTLYHYWRSSCSWRVRWALELKNISYKSVAVNLLKQEQKTSSYLSKNPTAQVPCIEYQGEYLGESIAIIEWLDEKFPGHKLFPSDPWSKAKVRQLVGVLASGTQPIQNLKILKQVDAIGGNRTDWGKKYISEGLEVYESLIQNTAGSFSFGGSITAADLCLIPQVYNAKRFGVDMSQFPICERIYQSSLKLSSCDKAAPHNQPGAQP